MSCLCRCVQAQLVALGSWASSAGLLTAALTSVQTHRVGTSPTPVAHFVDEETRVSEVMISQSYPLR